MKTFSDLSIKTKFNLFSGVIITTFIIVLMLFVFSVKKVHNYWDYLRQTDELAISYLDLRKNEQQFLLRYTEDPLFFKTGENKYLKGFDIASSNLTNLLNGLKESPLTDGFDILPNLNKLKDNNDNLKNSFSLLSKKLFDRGSKENGTLAQMVKARESAKKLTGNPNILDFIDKLVENEKNYLYNKDFTYYQNFLKNFLEFNNYLNTNRMEVLKTFKADTTMRDSVQYLDISTKALHVPAFIRNMNDYKRGFLQLSKIDREIGLNSEEGLNGDIKSLEIKIESQLDVIKNSINEKKDSVLSEVQFNLYIFLIAIILILILIVFRFSRSITDPLMKLMVYLQPLSKGIIPDKLLVLKGKNELSTMNQSVNELIEGLKKTTDFATSIGKGIFNTEFTPLSEKDDLGNSLIEMRKNLLHVQEEEDKRKYEDSLRKWSNEGLAKFADIMRQSTNEIEVLANDVIKNLVKFLNANQGGLFLYNDIVKDDIHLELMAAYAYDHERRKKKKILLGEGLVGTCAIEKATIYMTEIPQDYLTITSGLGQSNPRSLIIVPLKVEEQIFGVVEIASFNNFEKHEIEFVERVSESIAATLSIARINARTAELLAQSQQQAEEMAAQEEEMRQNLEELQATQEESARREAEMVSILNAINAASIMVEFDMNGKILEVNSACLELFKLSREQMIGRYQGDFDNMDKDKIKSHQFWERLKKGETIQETNHLRLIRGEVWLHEVYSPILHPDSRPYKILNLATDITESKRQELELRRQAEVMASQEEQLRQNIEELQATQEEMARKQNETEILNNRLRDNQLTLNEALEKAREQEKKVQQKNLELIASEEDLRMNMEKLQATQDEIQRQQLELSEANIKLEKNEQILKLALKEAREQEGTGFKLIDKSPDAILIINDEGKILRPNLTALNLLGFSKEELVEMSIDSVFPKIEIGNLADGLQIKMKLARKDQSHFIAGATIEETQWVAGEKVFIFYIKDITREVEKEVALITQYELALKAKELEIFIKKD